ncbi:uncharacterized protein LOC126293450 [Schistocerca gregaria]|uniref:uncharacterized protein LOC126293450 n=1 Tax=Schistocerca gregaria TaxID=7010 RepID=UPI00211E56F1|nr:uncharacterized protein LOC126293450 [Schistocerca gregaria]
MSSASAAAETSDSEEAEIVEEEVGEESDGDGGGPARAEGGPDASADVSSSRPMEVAPSQPGWAAVVWRVSGEALWEVAVRMRCLMLGLIQLVRPSRLLHTAYRRLESAAAALRPSDGRRGKLLAWLRAASGRDVPSVAAAWRDGRLLCAVVRSAVPGSCPAPEDSQLHAGLSHGQALAHKFLRVPPAFSDEECSGQPLLTRALERRLLSYLLAVQRACSRMALSAGGAGLPPEAASGGGVGSGGGDGGGGGASAGPCVVARGMGLVLAVQNRRAFFYVYLLRPQQGASDGEESDSDGGGGFHVHIVGPGGDFGSAVIPTSGITPALVVTDVDADGSEVHASAAPRGYTQQQRAPTRSRRGLRRRGAAPRTSVSLPGWPPRRPHAATTAPAAPGQAIQLDYRPVPATASSPAAAVCVSYTPRSPGPHQLSVIWRGRHVPGSPFRVSVDESDGRSTPPAEAPRRLGADAAADAAPALARQRRVLLRVVDFVTDKKVLLEDGRFAEMTPAQQRLLWRSNTEDPGRSSAVLRRLLTEANEERSLLDEVCDTDTELGGPSSSPSQDSGDAGSEADARSVEGDRPRRLRRSVNIQESACDSEDQGEHQVEEEVCGLQRQRYRRILGLCSLLLRQQEPRRQSLEILSAAEHLLNGRPVRISNDTDRLVRSAICTLKAGVPADEDRRPSSAPSSVRYGIESCPGDASGLNAISELEDAEPNEGLAGKGRTYFARSRCKDRTALPREGDQALQSGEGTAEGPASNSEEQGKQMEDHVRDLLGVKGGVGEECSAQKHDIPGVDPKTASLGAEWSTDSVPEAKISVASKSYRSGHSSLTGNDVVQKEVQGYSPPTEPTGPFSYQYVGNRAVTQHLQMETTIPVPVTNNESAATDKPARCRSLRNLSPADTSQPENQKVPLEQKPDLLTPTEEKSEETDVVPGIVRDRIAVFEKQPPLSSEEVPTTKKIHLCVHYIKPDEHTAKNGVEPYNNLSSCRPDSPCTFLTTEDSIEDEPEKVSEQLDSAHSDRTLLDKTRRENIPQFCQDTAKSSSLLTEFSQRSDTEYNSSLPNDKQGQNTVHPVTPQSTEGLQLSINTDDRRDLSTMSLGKDSVVGDTYRPELHHSGSLSQIDEEKLVDEVFRIFSEDSVESLDDFISYSQLGSHGTAEQPDHSDILASLPLDEHSGMADLTSTIPQYVSLDVQASKITLESQKQSSDWDKTAPGTSLGSSVSKDVAHQFQTKMAGNGSGDLHPDVHQLVSLDTVSGSQNLSGEPGSSGSRNIASQNPVRLEDEVQSSSVQDSEIKNPDEEPRVEVLTEDDIDLIYQSSVLTDTVVQTSADELFEELYESLHTEDEAESIEQLNESRKSSRTAPVNESLPQTVTSSFECGPSQADMEPTALNEFCNDDNASGSPHLQEARLRSTETKDDIEENNTAHETSSNEETEIGRQCLDAFMTTGVEDQKGEHHKQITVLVPVSKPNGESQSHPSPLLNVECGDESTHEKNSERESDPSCEMEALGDKLSISSDQRDHMNGSCKDDMTMGSILKFHDTVKTQADVQGSEADNEVEVSGLLGTAERVDLVFSASVSDPFEPSTEMKREESYINSQQNCPHSQGYVFSPNFACTGAEKKSSQPEDRDVYCKDTLGLADESPYSGEIGNNEAVSKVVEEVPECYSHGKIESSGEMVTDKVMTIAGSVGETIESEASSVTTDIVRETGGEQSLAGNMNEDNVGDDADLSPGTAMCEYPAAQVPKDYVVERKAGEESEQEAAGRSDDVRLEFGHVERHSEESTCTESVSKATIDDKTTMLELSSDQAAQATSTTSNRVVDEVEVHSSKMERPESPCDQFIQTNVSDADVGDTIAEKQHEEPTSDDTLTAQVTTSDVLMDELTTESPSEQAETLSSGDFQSFVARPVSSACNNNAVVLPSKLETRNGEYSSASHENNETCGVLIDFDVNTSESQDNSLCQSQNYGPKDSFENSVPFLVSEENENNASGGASDDILNFTLPAGSLMQPSTNFFDSQFDHFLAEKVVEHSGTNEDLLLSRRDDKLMTCSESVAPEAPHVDDIKTDGGIPDNGEDKERSTKQSVELTGSYSGSSEIAAEREQPLILACSSQEAKLKEDKIRTGESEVTTDMDQKHDSMLKQNVIPALEQQGNAEDGNPHEVPPVLQTEEKEETESKQVQVSRDTQYSSQKGIGVNELSSEEVNDQQEGEKQTTEKELAQKEIDEKEVVEEETTPDVTAETGIENVNMEEQKVIVNEKQMGNIEMEVVEKAEKCKETEQSDMEESENRNNNSKGIYETTEKDLVEKGKIVTENDKKEGEEYNKMVTEKVEELENGKKNSKGENEIEEEEIVEENEFKGKGRVTCEGDTFVTKEVEQAENENKNSKDENENGEVKRVKSEKEEKRKEWVTSEENKLVIEEMEEVEIEENKSEEENELREVLEEDKERKDEEWMTGKEDQLVIKELKENEKKSEKANETAGKEKDGEGAVSGDNPQLPNSIDSQPTPKSLLLADEDDAEFHLWPSDVPLGPPSGRSGVCSPVNAFDDSLVDFDSVISAPSLEEALRQFEDGLERARLQNERAAQENSDSTSGQYDNTGSAAGRASSEDANDYQSTPEGQYNSGEEQRAGDTGDSGYMSTDDLHNSLHRSPDVSSISGVPRNKSSPPHNGVKSDLPGRCKPFQKFTSDDKGHTGESGFMGPAEREIWGYQDDSDDESEWREGESTPVRYYPRVLSPGPPPMGPIAEEGEDGHDGNKTVVPATGGPSAVKAEGLQEEKKASPSITHASKSTFSSSNKSPDSFDDSDNKSSDNASLADNERSATPSDDSRDMSPQGCRDTGEGDPCTTSPPEKGISSVGNSAVESVRSHLERELSVPIIVIEDADLVDNLYTAFPPQIDRQVFSDSEVSGETQVKTRPRRRRLIYYDDTDLDVTKAVAATDASGNPRPESRTKTSGRKHGMRSREDKSGACSDGSPSSSQALLDTDGDVSSSILSECADGTSRSNEKFSVTTPGDGNCNLESAKLASSKGIGNETPAKVFNDETEEVPIATSGNDIHESVIPVQDIVTQNNLLVTESTQYPDTDVGGSQSCVHTEGKEAVKADISDASIPGDVPVKGEDTTPMVRTSNVTICVIGATPTPDILDLNGEAEVRASQDSEVTIPDSKDVDESMETATESEPAVKMVDTNEGELVPISEVNETPGSTDGVITGGGQHPAVLAGTELPADHNSVASCLAAVPVPSRVPPSAAQKRVAHWKQLWDVRCSFQKKRDRDGGVRRKRKSPSIRIPGIVSRWRKSFEASAGSASSAAISGQGGAGASSCIAGASAMTRASRIRQWRQYWDGLASAEAAQAQRDAGATRKLSKLPPSAVALFDRSQRDDLGTPDDCAPSAHQQSDSDLPAVSSWRFQSPTPPPSYQELVLSGVIKPPQPPAPRKKHHRPHVQRSPPLVPLHPTPAIPSIVEHPSSHDPPTTGRPLQETAALDTETLTSFPTIVSSVEQDPPVEDQKMGVIGAGQQKCTASVGMAPERVNRYSISSISVGEGATVRVVQSPDNILTPSQDTHGKPIVELREEVATPEPEPRILDTKKPHISSRYISAIGTKEESITSTRPKTSKVVHLTNKKRAQLEEVADVPVKDLVRNVGPVKNVVIIPRTTMDDTSYTSVYSTERAMYRTGKTERGEANANSFGSKVDSSQDLSKKQEPRSETPTIIAREHTVGEASGRSASGAVAEAAVTSRPSGGDRRQKEKDKVSLAEVLALEVQDFDSEDLASVQKLSGLFDDKKTRPATPSKTQTPPKSPTRKPAVRPAPVTASTGDSRDSEVQHLPEVKVPVVRVLVVEEEKKQQPPSPSPPRRASFSGELRSRPTPPAVAAPRPWSPTPQPSAAAVGDQGAEDAESRNRFERARMFFQTLEKSQGSSSRSGSLDSAPPFAECDDNLPIQRTKGHNRRRRRSGDGGSVTPGGGVQWEMGGPRWQSRLAERPGGSERLPRKVSERFHVRDLFRDVLGEGGVRGIPHQQAVLAALRSVESDGSRPVSPYEELAASGGISSPDPDPYPDADSDPDPDPVPELDCRRGCSSPEPQAYLSEYPYLPKTPTRQFRPRPALLQPTLIPRRELLKTE